MESPQIPPRLVSIGNLVEETKAVEDCHSNDFLFFKEIKSSQLVIRPNQKIYKITISNTTDSLIQVHDSVVLKDPVVEVTNCSNSTFLFDSVRILRVNCFNVENCTFQFSDFSTLSENPTFYWKNCEKNRLELTHIKTVPTKPETVLPIVVRKQFPISDSKDKCLKSYLQEGERLMEEEEGSFSRTPEDVEKELKVLQEKNAEIEAIPKNMWQQWYEEEIKEHRESEEEVRKKVKEVVKGILSASHPVVFTGAGVSTSAKIPDYRGPNGVWTVKARGETPPAVKLDLAAPTFSHYALTDLLKKGKIQFLVSTNVDSLHRRSGTSGDKITELHGNCYREVCSECGLEYLRDFPTTSLGGSTHFTGRNCDTCGGKLKDTIIHFTENVPETEWARATLHSRKSDFSLVLGTSMNVQPAASLTDKTLKNGGKLVIVNLQPTPYDSLASIRIFTTTDLFMTLLMQELGIPEKEFMPF